MRNKTVGVRLDDDEIRQIRKYTGGTDSERLRSIIHTRSIAEAISEPLEQRINALEQEIEQLRSETEKANTKMRRAGETYESINKSLNKLLNK